MGCLCCCFKKNPEPEPDSDSDHNLFNDKEVTKDNKLNNNISISVNDALINENTENTENTENIENIENIENTENIEDNQNIIITKESEEEYDDSNTVYSEKGLNLNENIGDNEPLIKADSPLICDYEKNVITFTKNGFIKLFEELWNLDNYKTVWDKDDLLIQLRYEGTPMNNNFYLVKMIYKLKKSDLKYNKDIESIMDYCYEINLRSIWDEALKKIEKYEGNDSCYIVCTWGKSPVFFVSERETIEKRFRFNKGNSTYTMSTSIPLDIYEPKKDVVRIIDFLNLFRMTDDGEYILFHTLNQVDFKMPIPQMLINITLPSTSKTWCENIKKFANSIVYDREKKTYERKDQKEEED